MPALLEIDRKFMFLIFVFTILIYKIKQVVIKLAYTCVCTVRFPICYWNKSYKKFN